MSRFNKKQFILVCLTLVLCLGLFGCVEQPVKNTNANVDTDEIDTLGWKTYKNEEFGFEFKYPGEWDKEEENKFSSDSNEPYVGVSFFDKDKRYNYHFAIGIKTNNDGSGSSLLIENFEKWHSEEMRGNQLKSVKVTIINNNEVIETEEYDGIGSVGKYFYFSNSNSVIYFGFGDKPDSENIFKDILLSFKFITKEINISDWQTYRNEEYGFEFRYPGDWFIQDRLLGPEKIEISDMGSSNAPIMFGLFSNNKDVFLGNNQVISFGSLKYLIENALRNSQDKLILVNGTNFKYYDLIDLGRYEGTSAGNVVIIYTDLEYNSSDLFLAFEWQEKPGISITKNEKQDFLQIIETIKID